LVNLDDHLATPDESLVPLMIDPQDAGTPNGDDDDRHRQRQSPPRMATDGRADTLRCGLIVGRQLG
jgi:hypothetical protein